MGGLEKGGGRRGCCNGISYGGIGEGGGGRGCCNGISYGGIGDGGGGRGCCNGISYGGIGFGEVRLYRFYHPCPTALCNGISYVLYLGPLKCPSCSTSTDVLLGLSSHCEYLEVRPSPGRSPPDPSVEKTLGSRDLCRAHRYRPSVATATLHPPRNYKGSRGRELH
ncbi:hypothetical protein T492DRAFT_372250 [Pavlovales sp. CCMP2436]|nr:hypothetical protein T492DRAFT_372250 [Pavlovales sp. CCMP2436]